MPNWVKIDKYCADTGDTPDAVQKKLKRGLWLKGTHAKKAPDGRLWIDTEAVNQWVQNGLAAAPAQLKSRSRRAA